MFFRFFKSLLGCLLTTVRGLIRLAPRTATGARCRTARASAGSSRCRRTLLPLLLPGLALLLSLLPLLTTLTLLTVLR